MRYLVGLSADRGGQDALFLGRMLARTGDVTLTVCMVLPEAWGYPSMARVDAEYAEFLRRHAEEAISGARAVIGEAVRAEYVIRHAQSATAGLLSTASEMDADLVVLGSARHGPLGRFTLGSVTNEMLHSAPVPVVVTPRAERTSSEARLRRLTCAFPRSTRSRTAFDAAVQLARRHDVPLRLTTLVVRDRQMDPSEVG